MLQSVIGGGGGGGTLYHFDIWVVYFTILSISELSIDRAFIFHVSEL